MLLKKVHLQSDVYMVCLQHALSTEKEEVMGLLIGRVDDDTSTSYISACKILARSDKQPDRVEISFEQLTDATTYAETLSKQLNEPMRVVGWYHSHPHITVWPSHVDLRTQAMYQNMDPMFVGLIFSVYPANTGYSLKNEIQLTCFQTAVNKNEHSRHEVGLYIEPSSLSEHCLQSLIMLPRILNTEDQDTWQSPSESSNILAQQHNIAMQTLSSIHITEKIAKPLLETLESRLSSNEVRIKILAAEKQKLQKQLKELK